MNYRHSYHAGNHADVLKHLILIACLTHLKQKPAPFAVLDTHAGAGDYALNDTPAAEWRAGAGRIFDWAEAPAAIAPYRAALHAANPDGALRAYPGSPRLARAALRGGDRLIACELHPEEADALKRAFRNDRQAQIHARDGWGALRALLPPAERRGLVLIDPPYEAEDELNRGAQALAEALTRFPGPYLWWRPLKDPVAVDAADAEVRARAPSLETLRVDLRVGAPDGKLNASSVLAANPPYGLETTLRAALPALAQRLAVDAAVAWAVT